MLMLRQFERESRRVYCVIISGFPEIVGDKGVFICLARKKSQFTLPAILN
jgi:hypothetical protein